jgi:hypothetical protein
MACVEELHNCYSILVENLKGRHHLGNLGERIILKWSLKKWG